jgi:Protein of unknown function (DUF541)
MGTFGAVSSSLVQNLIGLTGGKQMKLRYAVGAFLAVGVLGVLAACGGGDDDGDSGVPGIRTQKGLAVAAIAEGLAASGEQTDTTTGGAAAPSQRNAAGAPVPAPAGYDSAVSQTEPMRFGGAPLLQQGTDGVTVQGFGSATADADSAIIELYFSRNGQATDASSGRAVPGFAGGAAEPVPDVAPELQEVAPINEGELQPVIDAITGAGVPRDKIEFVAQPYYDKFYSSATLRVTIDDVSTVDGVVKAANDAAAGLAGITVNGTNVSHTVKDCTALEEAAMNAAVEDARERGEVFARTLGVGIGGVKGASNYSYFGGTPCDPGFYPGPYPLGGISYAEGQPREVQVIANISVTYVIQ